LKIQLKTKGTIPSSWHYFNFNFLTLIKRKMATRNNKRSSVSFQTSGLCFSTS
jgi:hypothetical protein